MRRVQIPVMVLLLVLIVAAGLALRPASHPARVTAIVAASATRPLVAAPPLVPTQVESSPAQPVAVRVDPTPAVAVEPAAAPLPAAKPAGAPAPVTAPITRSPSVVGTEALTHIGYQWSSLGYEIAFHAPRAGFYGLTDCTSRHIDIYVDPSQTVDQVAFVTAFEIGHAIDCAHGSLERQARWRTLRGVTVAGSWFPSCSCSEDAYPSGDFAEVFARSQVGAAYPWRSTVASAPTAGELPALVAFMLAGS